MLNVFDTVENFLFFSLTEPHLISYLRYNVSHDDGAKSFHTFYRPSFDGQEIYEPQSIATI